MLKSYLVQCVWIMPILKQETYRKPGPLSRFLLRGPALNDYVLLSFLLKPLLLFSSSTRGGVLRFYAQRGFGQAVLFFFLVPSHIPGIIFVFIFSLSHLSLPVTQMRGHLAGSSPPSVLRYVPCIVREETPALSFFADSRRTGT